MPNFRHTLVTDNPDWNNYHGTVTHHHVPTYAIIDAVVDTATAGTPTWRRQGEALSDVLGYCFGQNPVQPVRAVGSTWSLSDIITPGNVIIDPGRMNGMLKVSPAWFTQDYPGPGTPQGAVPMIVQGGARIKDINNALGQIGLALQTSGAGDGHRMAGCIATGTHGSALQIGAVHDKVLGMYLVIAPNQAVFVQPKTRPPFKDDLVAWFQDRTGIPTKPLYDDDAFAAALVSLGSLGFVHSVVLETVPLYRLKGRVIPRKLGDGAVFEAMRTMNTAPLHQDVADKPYHFSVIVNPYAGNSPGMFAQLYWKVGVDGAPFAGPSPTLPMAPSDTANFVGSLIHFFDGPVVGPIVDQIITTELAKQYPARDLPPLFPGQVFGPTSLPAGHSQSTEIVVDQARAVDALAVVLQALQVERAHGRHLLGAIGVRFVPQTKSLLGMNIAPMNCYMELGGISTPDIALVHQACWKALTDVGIPYTCHWGQQHRLDAAQVNAYYGDRVTRWKAARDRLLETDAAKTVFAAATLAKVGL